MSPECFWTLTIAEYDLLRFHWAQDQAQFFNAHFDAKGVPWVAEDFIGTASREKRRHEQMIAKAKGAAANMRLNQMKKEGTDIAYLTKYSPWAFGRKGVPGGATNR